MFFGGVLAVYKTWGTFEQSIRGNPTLVHSAVAAEL